MRFLALLGVMLAIFAMCGCQSVPITYYTLTPGDRGGTTAASGRPAIKAILVLRSLPAGIDTTQILIRTDDTRLRVEEGGRWVAPLGDELRGALVDALRHQYGIIVLDSARHNDAPVPRIDLTVRKFDVAEGSSITLAVDWALSNPGHEAASALLSCQAEFKETSASTVSGVVAAAQAAVLKLSRALGAAIEASSNGATPIC
ncbi:MAG: hypothetical protein JWL65_7262 [Gammaproteobacteria bacterium]|nr:hypothetical protein [Gammaproteobacteria bacterium]